MEIQSPVDPITPSRSYQQKAVSKSKELGKGLTPKLDLLHNNLRNKILKLQKLQ